MNGSFFKEMPKFKTPAEELDYLRAHVAKREEELKSSKQLMPFMLVKEQKPANAH